MMQVDRGTHRIWTAPILVAVAMLAGLFGALLTEDTILDGLAALTLFVALAWSVGLGLRSGRGRGSKDGA